MTAKEVFRGIGHWLSKTLFVMFLVGFVMGIAAANLTSESFLKPVIGEVISAQNGNAPVSGQYQRLLNECNLKGTENISSSLETDTKNYTIEINCDDLRANGEAEIDNIFKNQITDAIFYDFYNKKVCSGSGCINALKNLQNPLDVITGDFNKFFRGSLGVLGGLAALFGLFVILLARGLPGKFLSIGGSMVTAGLPYFMIKFLGRNIGSIIPSEAAMAVPFLTSLLNPVANIFLLILIVGVVSCMIGWGIKIYRKYHGTKESKDVKGKSGSGKKK